MNQFILRENTLTDDVLLLADDGKVFKGNFIALLKEHTYENSWSDRIKIRKFRSKETLLRYIEKKYPEFEFNAK
jgi:hypothetical protein